MGAEKKNSLLIIDDEKTNLQILVHILGPEYTIYTATSGESGMKIALEHLPDLILLDIIMPGMDGYQVLSEIKKNETTRRIPVIFITGLNSDKDEEKGLAHDAADYITKPFSNAIVTLRVRNQIQMINQLRTIEYLSMHDQLTQLPNRRSFDERLHMEWKRAIREQTNISMLMMDLDNFKKVNDTYGHQQGDKVLQMASNIFPTAFSRPGDFAARWGGEEFAILLPSTHLQGAMLVGERIRSEFEKMEIPCGDGSFLKVTISIGINSQAATLDYSIDRFISNADQALYDAKQAGRNRVHGYNFPAKGE